MKSDVSDPHPQALLLYQMHIQKPPRLLRLCNIRCTVFQAYMRTCYISLIRVHTVIVKASSGPRYVVGCRNKVDKAKLTAGTRVALDMTTLTIMRALPREVKLPGNRLQHLQSSLGFWKHQCFAVLTRTGSLVWHVSGGSLV